MNLERQIELIDDPQLFSRLCIAVLTAEYKTDYQAVDDNVADSGNDGYVASEKRLYARHCFKNVPGKRKLGDILKKMNSDFGKALKLRDSRVYEIERWTFLTNYNLTESHLAHLHTLAQGTGIAVNHEGPSHIAAQFLKHPELEDQFPQLTQPKVAEQLTEIRASLASLTVDVREINGTGGTSKDNETVAPKLAPPAPATDETKARAQNKRDPELAKVIGLMNKTDKASKAKLKMLAYASPSKAAQVQAALSLSYVFDIEKEDPQDYIEICDMGLVAAYAGGYKAEAAVLLADKARYLTHQLVKVELDHWYAREQNGLFGFMVVEPSYLENLRKRALELDEKRRKVAVDALTAAGESNNARAYAQTLLYLGESAGQIAIILHKTGDPANGRAQLGLSKNLLMQSKALYDSIGDDQGATYTLHNLSIQLRGFDNDLALDLNGQVIAKARRANDTQLLERANIFKQIIEREAQQHSGK